MSVGEAALRAGIVVAVFFVSPLLVGQMEHKVMAHMQGRLGPMSAGGFHGWAQLIADAVKFLQKQQITPAAASKKLFAFAPLVALLPVMLALAAVPLSPQLIAADLDAGLVFVLAVASVGVFGTLMAGWSSGNKYSVLGAVRAVGQLVAYEVPLLLAAISFAIASGSLSLVKIGEAWSPWWLIWQAGAGVIFFIAALAELQRTPFDAPIADTEIVAGTHTEYTGLRFALFLFTEYAGIVLMSLLISVMFLGGWHSPFGVGDGPWWTVAKVVLVAFVIIWVRVAWPRLRADQIQRLSWHYLVPLGIVQVGVSAAGVLIMS